MDKQYIETIRRDLILHIRYSSRYNTPCPEWVYKLIQNYNPPVQVKQDLLENIKNFQYNMNMKSQEELKELAYEIASLEEKLNYKEI